MFFIFFKNFFCFFPRFPWHYDIFQIMGLFAHKRAIPILLQLFFSIMVGTTDQTEKVVWNKIIKNLKVTVLQKNAACYTNISMFCFVFAIFTAGEKTLLYRKIINLFTDWVMFFFFFKFCNLSFNNPIADGSIVHEKMIQTPTIHIKVFILKTCETNSFISSWKNITIVAAAGSDVFLFVFFWWEE